MATHLRWLHFLVAASFVALAWGQELHPLPPLLRTVSDETGVLSAAQGKALADALAEIYRATGVPVILVIAETTKPEGIRDYTDRLSQRWQEQRKLDPARAIFIIVSIEEREMQVLPGLSLGLEAALSREHPNPRIPPLFRQGRYFEGLVDLIGGVRAVIEQNPPPR